MILNYSRGRTLEYDLSPVLEHAKPGMTKDEIQDIVFDDFNHYTGLDRMLLLMKTGEIIQEALRQIQKPNTQLS